MASQHLIICWPVVNFVRPAFRTWKRIQPLSSQRLIVWRSTPSSFAASAWVYRASGSHVGLVDTITRYCKGQPCSFARKTTAFQFLHSVGRVLLAIQVVAACTPHRNSFARFHLSKTLAGYFFSRFLYHFCHFYRFTLIKFGSFVGTSENFAYLCSGYFWLSKVIPPHKVGSLFRARSLVCSFVGAKLDVFG